VTSAENIKEAAPDSRSNVWLHAIWLVAFLPFIQAIITWDYDGRMTDGWFALRHFSFPAILGEIIVIVMALRGGMLPSAWIARLSSIVKILLAICGLAALASTLLVAENSAGSALIISRYLIHILFLATLVSLIRQARTFSPAKWLRAIAIGMLAYVGVLVIFAITIPDPENFPWMLRMPSATNIRQIANNLAIPAVAPIALLLFHKGKGTWFNALAVFATVCFISWTGSRGALASILVCSFLALLIVRKMPDFRALAITCGSIFLGMAASLSIPSPAASFGLFRFVSKVQTPENITSGRLEMWQNTFIEITKSPWLGYGSGSYNGHMRELYGFDFNHPHNFILQFAYDWGIFGSAAVTALLVILGISIARRARQNMLAGFAAIAAFLAMIMTALIDGALFHPLTIILPIAVLAPIFAADKSPRDPA